MPAAPLTADDLTRISRGYDPSPEKSYSLLAEAYTDPTWHDVERDAIFRRSWQWICHVERVREPGTFVTATVGELPIFIARGHDGHLRGFHNVCKHRAHELLTGSGTTRNVVCPYHAWTYDLDGRLKAARRAEAMPGFDRADHCLDAVQVEEFGGFVYANLDPAASPLTEQAPDLAAQIAQWAPDVSSLTLAKRLEYRINSNWKNVVDNFLECYHCHIAHPEFVDLVEMTTYDVKTYGIWSSHFADAGEHENSAYDVSTATVRTHAVWWLWPNTCLLRYPGRSNFMVLQILSDGPGRTRETWDFYLEDAEPNAAEIESMRYVDEVLQVQDVAIVESVQRGMSSPAFQQGRIVSNPEDSSLSEHAVHHFHGLVLQAYGDLIRGTS